MLSNGSLVYAEDLDRIASIVCHKHHRLGLLLKLLVSSLSKDNICDKIPLEKE